MHKVLKMKSKYMKQNYDFKEYSVQDFFDAINEEQIKVPRFQRDIVWSSKQVDELANSLKIGIPFGTFLLAGDNSFILLDGLQRTHALHKIYRDPQKFFSKDQIDNSIINQINQLLIENNAVFQNEQDNEIRQAIEDWVKSSPNTDAAGQFNGFYLAEHLFDRFSVKNEIQIAKKANNILSELIKMIIDEIKNIGEIKIPCIIYKGSDENLPLVFEKLNSTGTSLTKFQIFAANWVNNNLHSMKDKKIKKIVYNKYIDRQNQGDITVDQLPENENDFLNQDLNVYEYLLGLGNLLEQDFPFLFAKKGDTIGFTLSAACLQGSIRKIGRINEIINDSFDFENFQNALFDSTNIVNNELKPYITILINRSKSNNKPKPIIFHSDYQIISFISKVFRERFDIKNMKEKEEWNKDKKWINNIPYHYLFDQLEDNWRGSGDTRIEEMLSTDRYKQQITRQSWINLLDKWFKEKEISKQQKSRVSIDNIELLFLNYIYAHTISFAEVQGSKIFNLEHLVSVDLLSKYIQEYKIEGLPISAISNICYLDATINKKKREKTIYEFLRDNPETANIYEIESKYTFTKESDLEFVSFLNEKDIEDWKELYIEFLKNRFENLKELFLDLNSIKD